jgi:hypothetical protein
VRSIPVIIFKKCNKACCSIIINNISIEFYKFNFQPNLLLGWPTTRRPEVGGKLSDFRFGRTPGFFRVGGVENEGDVIGQGAAAAIRNELGLEATRLERSLIR